MSEGTGARAGERKQDSWHRLAPLHTLPAGESCFLPGVASTAAALHPGFPEPPCTGGTPGICGSVPAGDTLPLALLKGAIVPLPGAAGAVCGGAGVGSGLALAPCPPPCPFPAAAACGHGLAAVLPAGLAGAGPLSIASAQGCDTWGRCHGCHEFAVLNLAVAFLCISSVPGWDRLRGDKQGAGSPCPAKKSLWKGARWLHHCRSDVSDVKSPDFPSQEGAVVATLPRHTGALGGPEHLSQGVCGHPVACRMVRSPSTYSAPPTAAAHPSPPSSLVS